MRTFQPAITLPSVYNSTHISITGGTLLLSSPISGPGGLTETGSGTLIVSGADTFTGSTTVAGGMLVAEGFALADPTQSYDYFSAEAAARQLRRGLWQYR